MLQQGILHIQAAPQALCSFLVPGAGNGHCWFFVVCRMSKVAPVHITPNNFTVWMGSGIFAGSLNQPLSVMCVTISLE